MTLLASPSHLFLWVTNKSKSQHPVLSVGSFPGCPCFVFALSFPLCPIVGGLPSASSFSYGFGLDLACELGEGTQESWLNFWFSATPVLPGEQESTHEGDGKSRRGLGGEEDSEGVNAKGGLENLNLYFVYISFLPCVQIKITPSSIIPLSGGARINGFNFYFWTLLCFGSPFI